MFVRIQHEDTSTLYECGKADLIPNDRPHRVHLSLEGVPGMGTVGSIIHKGRVDLYFMNDQGQTIDQYNWPVFDTGRDDTNGDRIFTGDKVKAKLAAEVGPEVAVGKVKKHGDEFVVDFDLDRHSEQKLSDLNEVSRE